MASLRDIGQGLKEAREAQGLTLDEIAARTRITVRHLIALEEGNESDLPEVFYVRGFLKKYAEAVGLSPREVADAYRAAPIPTPTQPTIGSTAGPIVRGVLILGMLGGIFYLAWYFQPKLSVVAELSPSPAASVAPRAPHGQGAGAASGAAIASGAAVPAASAASSAEGAASGAKKPSPAAKGSAKPSTKPGASAKPAATPSAKGSTKPTAKPSAKPSTRPSSKPVTSPKPSAPASTTPAPAASGSTAPRSSAKPSATPSGTITVELTIEQRSWVEVRVDGHGAYEGLLSPKTHKSFKGHTVMVSAGNAGGVRVTVNGHSQGHLGEHGVVVAKTYKP